MSETFTAALAKVERRRLIMQSRLWQKKEEIYNAVPQLQELSDKAVQLGAERALAILQKNSEKAEQIKAQMDDVNRQKVELLSANGYSEDDLTLQHFCPICKDTGFVNGKVCQCVKTEAAKLRQEQLSAMSPAPKADFCDFSLDLYPKGEMELTDGQKVKPYDMMCAVFDYCKKYADSFNTSSKSLFLIGSSGLGKTHIACSIAKEAMKKGYSVMYASAQSLFSQIEQNRYADDDALRDILNCDLFVLDDLGAEVMTNYTRSCLYNIINTRMITEKPCIITSNIVSSTALKKRYPEKITSRLLGAYQKLYFYGKDIRILKNR